jgi:Ca-activated chloride channel family protein
MKLLGEATFVNPEVLWLLALLPVLAVWLLWRDKKRTARITVPVLHSFATKNMLGRLRTVVLLFLRLLALALLIVAMARPQSTDMSTQKRGSEGIDIVLAVDISPSMLARDLKPNRLEALKVVAQKFVDGRPGDRIGLVIYAGESFAQVPLTTDHKIVKNSIAELRYDLLENGTAIGMGLATAVNRIKESEAVSKVIILLTDGENNKGIIDPKTAAELAKQYNIRVYTIGVGTKGFAETPVAIDLQGQFVYQPMQVNIDEELLQYIADETSGKYFRATNNKSLEEIYSEIDKLEKTKLEELTFYNYEEHFYRFALLALGLLVVEWLLRLTLFRSIV